MAKLYINSDTLIKPKTNEDTGFIAEAINIKYGNKSLAAVIEELWAAIGSQPEPQLVFQDGNSSISIARPKGTTVSSISSVTGGSINPTSINVGENSTITASSITIAYSNEDKPVDIPVVLYNNNPVTLSWVSNDQTIVTNNFVAKKPGTAIMTGTYEGKTIEYTITVTNATNTETKTSGWTYTSSNTNVATINGNIISGISAGTTDINVSYGGKTKNITTLTVIDNSSNNTWYFGETEQESFTTDDFNQTGTKPTTLNIGASSDNIVTVWIYPQSWGKPSQILDENSNDMTNGFTYGSNWMTVPSDYYGAWLQTPVAGTITLTW